MAHVKGCNDQNLCEECKRTDRYCGWVKEYGVTEAMRMQKEAEKNRKRYEKCQRMLPKQLKK